MCATVFGSSVHISSSYPARPFNGFVFGVKAGPNFYKAKVKQQKNFRLTTGQFGIFGGYGFECKDTYIGGEIGIDYINSKTKKNDLGALNRPAQLAITPAVRMGYDIGKAALPFLKVGYQFSKASVFKNTAGQKLGTTRNSGLLLGGGLDFRLPKNPLFARVEYQHNFGKTSTVNNARINTQSDAVTLGLGYVF